jgi:hypothetical protein
VINFGIMDWNPLTLMASNPTREEPYYMPVFLPSNISDQIADESGEKHEENFIESHGAPSLLHRFRCP